MGAFHEGHLSLIRQARADCEIVVVSLFVNPTQFNEATDLDAYPRDERRDAAFAAELGGDYLFAPGVEEVYPGGFSTRVQVDGVSEVLEGAHRGRGHFDGVATVVCKLFGMVAPDVAYFGHKDFQQTLVIRRLARDLNIPVAIEICATVREANGLAMSSRNVRLAPADFERAAALYRALREADAAVREGARDAQAVRARATGELVRNDGIELEYFELTDADTLLPVQRIEGRVIALVAARVGGVRLIDNLELSTVDSPVQLVAAGSADMTKGK
jgi:pantoate--beta-alanine ligase